MSKFLRRPLQSIRRGEPVSGFTLLEMLVATAIFMLLMALLVSVVGQFSNIWQASEAQKNRQQAARLIFDRVTRDLEAMTFPLISGATNSLRFLVNPNVSAVPKNPSSAFWQTTLTGGTTNGDIADVGYFLRFSPNSKGGMRGELCRVQFSPTNSSALVALANKDGWPVATAINDLAPATDSAATNAPKGVLADNVLGLWFKVYSGTNEMYPAGNLTMAYDSRTNTGASVKPTSVEVAVAMSDARTMQRVTAVPTYNANLDTFLNSLPENIRPSVQIFKTRVVLEAAP